MMFFSPQTDKFWQKNHQAYSMTFYDSEIDFVTLAVSRNTPVHFIQENVMEHGTR